MTGSVERKLTTILCADVVGYSRLMGEDETGTLARLKSDRQVMTDFIERYGGRIFNTAGDSLLANFPSVVNAVECAIGIHRALAERNAGLTPDRHMWFRIGINLGDVIVERDGLYGEGVNVASRLQSLADPGGIMVSGAVFDQVKNKLTVGFDFVGTKPVKNIADRVPIYRVLLQSGPAIAPDATPTGKDAGLWGPAVHRLFRAGAGEPPRPVAGEPGVSAHSDAGPQRWSKFAVSAARATALIGFFFAVNMLSWDGELWFQWPTLIIALVFSLSWIRRRSGE